MRDAVRLVQDARKQAGLEVAERIALALDADDEEAAGALDEHRAALAAEVLAVDVRSGDLDGDAFRIDAELGGGRLAIALRRVG